MSRDESETGTAPTHDDATSQLFELLTVDDVAALLKVSRSWVYEHTRARSAPQCDRLPPDTLAQKMTAAGTHAPMRSRVTCRTLASEWEVSVVPMYKHSTQIHRRFMLKKHLLPRFGDRMICEVTRQEIQAYVAHLMQLGYAPRSIDHVHDVLARFSARL